MDDRHHRRWIHARRTIVTLSHFVDGLLVEPVADVDPSELGSFLASTSTDEALCDKTYLPPRMGPVDALLWARERFGQAWVLRLDGVPIGWFEIGPVRSSCGFDLPAETREWEVWLLPEFRGRRLVRAATALLGGTLRAAGVSHLVGVTWESNVAAVRGMENAGFVRLGRGWWEYGEYTSGWCEVWLLAL